MKKYRVRLPCSGVLGIGEIVYPYLGYTFGAIESLEASTGRTHCAVTRDPSGWGNDFQVVPTFNLERVDPYENVRPLL